MTAAERMSSAIPDDIHGVAANQPAKYSNLSRTLRLNLLPRNTSSKERDWVTPSQAGAMAEMGPGLRQDDADDGRFLSTASTSARDTGNSVQGRKSRVNRDL
jgi:hypothetical protein